jgi:chromosome partitioning protein
VFSHYITDGDGISAAASVNFPVYSVDALPRGRQNAEKQSAMFKVVVDELLTRLSP